MNTDFKKLFGQRIKTLRKRRNLTQEKLAELLSMDTPNLCKMENGYHFIQTKNIEKLANVLEVDLKELFDFDDSTSDIKSIKKKIDLYLNGLNKNQLKFIYKVITTMCEYWN